MLEKIKKQFWMIDALLKTDFTTKKQLVTNFLTAKKKYIPKEKRDANIDSLLKCALCPNMCRFDCPVSMAEKSESSSPAGKMKIAYFLETGKIQPSESAIDLMYKDVNCDACKQWCPFGFSIGELLIGVRNDLVKKGLVPERLVQFKEKLEENHTIYEGGIKSLCLDKNKKSKVLYIAGCTTLNGRREVADSTVTILERAGIDYTTLSEEWCCGAPLYILGFRDSFQKFVNHNLNAIKETECETIIFSCPECLYTFKELYPQSRLKVEMQHTSQFFLKLIEEGKLGPMELDEEYVFHDPCVLSRKLDIAEEPRKVLKNISKLKLKETYFNKKDTKCCGSGGMLGVTDQKLSSEIAKNRVLELKEYSNSIVSACPACEKAFKEADDKIKVLDISEVILKGIKNA